MFNDIAVAAGVAMRSYGLERVLVVDLDVHQVGQLAGEVAGDSRRAGGGVMSASGSSIGGCVWQCLPAWQVMQGGAGW